MLMVPINLYAGSLVKLCDKIDKVAGLVAPLTYVPFQTIQYTPTGPVPGIIMAMVQPDSVFLDMCNMYKTLQTAQGLDRVKMMANYGNTLMGNKFTEHINYSNDLLDTTDFMNRLNKMDSNSLDKFKVAAPRINNFLGTTNDYYTYLTGKRIETLTTRSERERDMNSLANSSRNLAIYGSMLECESKKSNASDSSLSTSNIGSFQQETDMYKADVDYLYDRLRNMGIKFSNGTSDYKVYLEDLYDLYNSGVEYEGAIKNYTEKTNSKLPDGSIKQKDISRSYQVMSVKSNLGKFDAFKNKYSPKWKNYIASNYFDETKGFLDGRSGRIQQEFYDFSFECRESLIYETVKNRSPDFFKTENDPRKFTALRAESDNCRKTLDKSPSKIRNILELYTENLKSSLLKYKQAQSKVWTIDSYYNGSFRSITKGSVGLDPNGPKREEVSCSKNISLAEQANLKLKLKLENANLRQKSLEELEKEDIRIAKEKAETKSIQEEESRRMMIQNEIKKRNSQDYSKYITYPEVNGGI